MSKEKCNRVINKPRGQLKGMGVNQMTTLLHKPYLLKVSTKGGGKIPKKCVHVVYRWPIVVGGGNCLRFGYNVGKTVYNTV